MTEIIEIEVDREPEAELEVIEAALKPETVGHGVPGWEAQTVRPEAGCVFSSFEMEGMPEPTAEETVTENGRYPVARLGFLKVQVPQPAGEVELTENRDYDVSGYETAKVRVPQGVFPAGTLPVLSNGSYDVTEFAGVNVAVNTDPGIGVVFADFTANGLPQTVRTVGMTEVPAWCLYMSNNYNRTLLLSQIKTVILNEGVIKTNDSSIRGLKNLTRVVLPSTMRQITVNTFLDDAAVTEYDFSACTAVPKLGSAASLGHAAGCVLKVPAELLAEWQAAANWNALTNVVWQGV